MEASARVVIKISDLLSSRATTSCDRDLATDDQDAAET
jgi:hypothetical protein